MGGRSLTLPEDLAAVLAWAAFGLSGCRAGSRLCESSARRSSDVCLRFDAPARDRPFGHHEADIGAAGPVECTVLMEHATSGVTSRKS